MPLFGISLPVIMSGDVCLKPSPHDGQAADASYVMPGRG